VRVFFIRVSEHADAIKANVFDELHQFAEIFVSLARKADDEGCAQRNVRHKISRATEQLFEHRAIAAPPHQLEHLRARVLKRHIQVTAHLFFFRHHCERRIAQ